MNTKPRSLPIRPCLEMGISLAGVRVSRHPRPCYRVVYRLHMRNVSTGSVCLLGRKWTLRDRSGHTRVVEASQVFNQQPVLTPGAVFSCSGSQDFDTPPVGMEVSFFGTDRQNHPFITPPLTFPARTFELPW